MRKVALAQGQTMGAYNLAPMTEAVQTAVVETSIQEGKNSDILKHVTIATYPELKIKLPVDATAMHVQSCIVQSSEMFQFEVFNFKNLPDLEIPEGKELLFVTKTFAETMPVLKDGMIYFRDAREIKITKQTLLCVSCV